MSTKELVQNYYRSLSQKDDTWKDLYSEDVIFSDASQTLHSVGKAAVIQSFVTFLKGVAEIKVRQMIVEGEKACAIIGYVYVNPKGDQLRQDVAEVWLVKNDKLAELTLYFDLLAYRNFMRS